MNEKSLEAVKRAAWTGEFCKPLYESYCFSKIPATLLHLLGVKADPLPKDCFVDAVYDSVILFLIDGFGWQFLEKHYNQYPFLLRFFKDGIVSKLTSQFPSTTAAHITTLCSGLEVGQSAVYEWFFYEPQLNRVIAPLLYSYAGDKKLGTLKNVITPDKLFPPKTIFQKLQDHKIPSQIFQHESIAHSPYSSWMFRGAQMKPYKKLSDCKLDQKGLTYVYAGDVDSEAHRHGIDSKRVAKEIDRCFTAMEKLIQDLPPNTACIVTADHGMTPIDPKTTVYLNKEFPQLESCLKKGEDGHALTPAGSCRDYFLHVEPEKVEEVKEMLEGLEDKAYICETKQLIEEGFFGSKPVSDQFLKRVGNLVILPYGSNSVWWFEKGRFQQKFFAMHGGLTRAEMETIFLFLPK